MVRIAPSELSYDLESEESQHLLGRIEAEHDLLHKIDELMADENPSPDEIATLLNNGAETLMNNSLLMGFLVKQETLRSGEDIGAKTVELGKNNLPTHLTISQPKVKVLNKIGMEGADQILNSILVDVLANVFSDRFRVFGPTNIGELQEKTKGTPVPFKILSRSHNSLQGLLDLSHHFFTDKRDSAKDAYEVFNRQLKDIKIDVQTAILMSLENRIQALKAKDNKKCVALQSLFYIYKGGNCEARFDERGVLNGFNPSVYNLSPEDQIAPEIIAGSAWIGSERGVAKDEVSGPQTISEIDFAFYLAEMNAKMSLNRHEEKEAGVHIRKNAAQLSYQEFLSFLFIDYFRIKQVFENEHSLHSYLDADEEGNIQNKFLKTEVIYALRKGMLASYKVDDEVIPAKHVELITKYYNSINARDALKPYVADEKDTFFSRMAANAEWIQRARVYSESESPNNEEGKALLREMKSRLLSSKKDNRSEKSEAHTEEVKGIRVGTRLAIANLLESAQKRVLYVEWDHRGAGNTAAETNAEQMAASANLFQAFLTTSEEDIVDGTLSRELILEKSQGVLTFDSTKAQDEQKQPVIKKTFQDFLNTSGDDLTKHFRDYEIFVYQCAKRIFGDSIRIEFDASGGDEGVAAIIIDENLANVETIEGFLRAIAGDEESGFKVRACARLMPIEAKPSSFHHESRQISEAALDHLKESDSNEQWTYLMAA
jgi:hypothetical protein